MFWKDTVKYSPAVKLTEIDDTAVLGGVGLVRFVSFPVKSWKKYIYLKINILRYGQNYHLSTKEKKTPQYLLTIKWPNFFLSVIFYYYSHLFCHWTQKKNILKNVGNLYPLTWLDMVGEFFQHSSKYLCVFLRKERLSNKWRVCKPWETFYFMLNCPFKWFKYVHFFQLF